MDFSWDLFGQLPVVGILRGFSLADSTWIVDVARDAGLRNLEVTMNTPDAATQIRTLQERASGQMNIGAGTVCNMADLDAALDAGANFIVTPIVAPDVIAECGRRKIPIAVGALTPTEIDSAWTLGADWVKVFPAEQMGPAYIKNLKGPLPDIRLLPTGGVTVENAKAYRDAGAEGVGVGGPLFARDKVNARDDAWMTAQIQRFYGVFAEE